MFVGSFFLFLIPLNALTMGLGVFVTLTICTEILMRYLLACMESYITLEHKDTLSYLQKNLQIALEIMKEKYQKYESECKYRHYSFEKLNEYCSVYNNLWSIFIIRSNNQTSESNDINFHNTKPIKGE